MNAGNALINRPFEVLELDLSGFATYRDLATVPRIYGRTVTNRSGTSKG